MVAADDDWGFHATAADQFIERQARLGPLAAPEPADPRRKSLKRYPFAREPNPPRQMLVLRKQLENRLIRRRDIRRVARKCTPSEWPGAFAKQRSDEFRYKPG